MANSIWMEQLQKIGKNHSTKRKSCTLHPAYASQRAQEGNALGTTLADRTHSIDVTSLLLVTALKANTVMKVIKAGKRKGDRSEGDSTPLRRAHLR